MTRVPRGPQPSPQGTRRRPPTPSESPLHAGPTDPPSPPPRGHRRPKRPPRPFRAHTRAGPPPCRSEWGRHQAERWEDTWHHVASPPPHVRAPHPIPTSPLTGLQRQALGTQGHGGRSVGPCSPSPGSGASGPPGPRLPPLRAAGGRLRKRQPGVCARAYISRGLFLPWACPCPGL